MSGRALCCLWRRWCSGRRRALLWGRAAWCARGRRPAREPSAPRASLGASPRSPARPRRRPRAPQPGQAPPPPTGATARPPDPPAPSTPAARLVLLCVAPSFLLLSNFTRNSPVTISEFELASLELERFWAVFKSDRGKLRADLVSPRLCRHPRAPRPGPAAAHGRHSQALLPPTGTAAWSMRLLCV